MGNAAAAARETVTTSDLEIGEINRPSPPRVAETPPAAPEPTESAEPASAKVQPVALTTPPVNSSVAQSVPDHASVTILRGMDLSVEKVLAEDGRAPRRDDYYYPFLDAGSAPIDLRPPPIRARSVLDDKE